MQPFREYRKLKNGKRAPYAKWRGRIVVSGKRRKVVLFTDAKVSKRELLRLQAEADAETQDGPATQRRRHQARPIGEHVADYLSYIRRTTKSKDHHRITDFMLSRLVRVAGWSRLSDISQESMELVLKRLAADTPPATVSYQNAFIKRAKAFVNWCVPERLAMHPLLKLRRGNVTRAVKNRARRAATAAEITGLFKESPPAFHFKWAFPLLTGFRRHEFSQLKWGDLRLNAPIPFIQLRPEWTKNEKADVLPLHPVLVEMLHATTPGMPGVHVVSNVPDVKTLKKYLERGGGRFIDGNNRRLDYHALRHTFKSNLDEAGCSEATKKALMRHSVSDVTGGYSHPRLAELYEAVKRLPSPFITSTEQPQVRKTGTTDAIAGGTDAGQSECGSTHSDALPCTIGAASSKSAKGVKSSANLRECTPVHAAAWSQLPPAIVADTVPETRPSTQVDYSKSIKSLGKSPSQSAGGTDAGHQVASGCADSSLAEVITAWPDLIAPLRAAVLALVRAASSSSKPTGRAVGASGKEGRKQSRVPKALTTCGFRQKAASAAHPLQSSVGLCPIGRVGRPSENKKAATVTALGGASRKRRVPNSRKEQANES